MAAAATRRDAGGGAGHLEGAVHNEALAAHAREPLPHARGQVLVPGIGHQQVQVGPFLENGGKVVVPEEHRQLPLLHLALQREEPLRRQLVRRRLQKVLDQLVRAQLRAPEPVAAPILNLRKGGRLGGGGDIAVLLLPLLQSKRIQGRAQRRRVLLLPPVLTRLRHHTLIGIRITRGSGRVCTAVDLLRRPLRPCPAARRRFPFVDKGGRRRPVLPFSFPRLGLRLLLRGPLALRGELDLPVDDLLHELVVAAAADAGGGLRARGAEPPVEERDVQQVEDGDLVRELKGLAAQKARVHVHARQQLG
mmetsp:Transcript_34091/g.73843  ORF Transcript_34091/g.73843 Transcript_34091/m.73843 type:complete len:306 (+) Transcript_34091:438-1355(+)